jgi:hypothetical protein
MTPWLMQSNIARLREKPAAEKDESTRAKLENPVAESEQMQREVALTFGQSGNNETRQLKRSAVLYAGKYF